MYKQVTSNLQKAANEGKNKTKKSGNTKVPHKVQMKEMRMEILSKFIHNTFLIPKVRAVPADFLKERVTRAHPDLKSEYGELLRCYLTRNIGIIAKRGQTCELYIFKQMTPFF